MLVYTFNMMKHEGYAYVSLNMLKQLPSGPNSTSVVGHSNSVAPGVAMLDADWPVCLPLWSRLQYLRCTDVLPRHFVQILMVMVLPAS